MWPPRVGMQGESECLRELGIGVVVGIGEMFEETFARFAGFGNDLGEPDERLDSFDLAEERPDGFEFVVTPVLEKARGFRGDLPFVGVRPVAPLVDVDAEFVDDGRGIVLLLLSGEAFAFVEDDLLLVGLALALTRLGDRGDRAAGAVSI